jgi:hypothetical protein
VEATIGQNLLDEQTIVKYGRVGTYELVPTKAFQEQSELIMRDDQKNVGAQKVCHQARTECP